MNRSDKPTFLTAGELTDRVMSAIALLPTPTPTRTFLAAVRARGFRDAVTALWVAWHLGTVRSWHVAPRVRARSFALVLAVTSVLATGGLAAAAAVHSVVPQRDDRVPDSAPSGSSVDEGPAGSGQTASDGPDETDESPATSDEPEPTDHGGSGPTVDTSDGADHDQHPTKGVQGDEADDHDGDHHDGEDDGAAATDDHGGSDDGDAPDASDGPDHSSDGGDGPDATDDHSGSGGGDAPDSASEDEPGGD